MSILYRNKHSTNAKGGTEILAQRLAELIPSEILDEFQIFVSRVEEPLDETKIRLYWVHDLHLDPATEHLANGGWKNFHKIVFVSNWQMRGYIERYNIPWSHCIVMHNAIDPIEQHEKPTEGPIRLAYWSTPHRGLDILVPVFNKLAEDHDIELDVYSSFNLYGWPDRDEAFQQLFDQCREHPKINYHGAVDNNIIREALTKTHILAYPNTWLETSCMVLMEAMSAKMLCVHPNYGALPETAANWTHSYQYHEDKNAHAGVFYKVLGNAIEQYNPKELGLLEPMKGYADIFYTWNGRQFQWLEFLKSLASLPREIPKDVATDSMFVYNT